MKSLQLNQNTDSNAVGEHRDLVSALAGLRSLVLRMRGNFPLPNSEGYAEMLAANVALTASAGAVAAQISSPGANSEISESMCAFDDVDKAREAAEDIAHLFAGVAVCEFATDESREKGPRFAEYVVKVFSGPGAEKAVLAEDAEARWVLGEEVFGDAADEATAQTNHSSAAPMVKGEATLALGTDARVADVPADVTAFTGWLQVPGAGRVQIDFVAPQGATKAEKDAAFLNAIVKSLDGDYLGVGDSPSPGGATMLSTGEARNPQVLAGQGDARVAAARYEKLRAWMTSNVPEGWKRVEDLGAIGAWMSWGDFDRALDAMPDCNVGLCTRAKQTSDVLTSHEGHEQAGTLVEPVNAGFRIGRMRSALRAISETLDDVELRQAAQEALAEDDEHASPWQAQDETRHDRVEARQRG